MLELYLGIEKAGLKNLAHGQKKTVDEMDVKLNKIRQKRNM